MYKKSYDRNILVDDAKEKWNSLACFVNHIAPGRSDEVRQPNANELKATMVLAFELDEASAKIRNGGPSEEEADYALNVWAGVVPLKLVPRRAQPDTRLMAGTRLPELNPIHEAVREKG